MYKVCHHLNSLSQTILEHFSSIKYLLYPTSRFSEMLDMGFLKGHHVFMTSQEGEEQKCIGCHIFSSNNYSAQLDTYSPTLPIYCVCSVT